jgi:hypothetical protein
MQSQMFMKNRETVPRKFTAGGSGASKTFSTRTHSVPLR